MTNLEQQKAPRQGSAECMVIVMGGNVYERQTVANNSGSPWDQEESCFLPLTHCVAFCGLTFQKRVPLRQEPQGGGKELASGPQLAWSQRAGFKIMATAESEAGGLPLRRCSAECGEQVWQR